MQQHPRIDRAQQMFLDLLPVHRKLSQQRGEQWTIDQELALFVHCCRVNHIKPDTLAKRFVDDGFDGPPA